MDFRILGSLEVWDGERQLELGGPKRRAVLALLLLHANEVVSVDRLVDQLWGEKAPRNAAGAVHTHVSRLRKDLGAEVVTTLAWGYVLRPNPDELDLERFERLSAEAENLPAGERAGKLREALAGWRGPPLEDLASEPGLATDIARLEELRLMVLEKRIDADLEAGHEAGLVAELEALIAEQPLRERLRGQLILALYRSGRQAEALEVYRETRRMLADELGLEPSPDLRELERAILQHDPALRASGVNAVVLAAEPGVRSDRHRRVLVGASLALLLAGLGTAAAVSLSTRSTRTTRPTAEQQTTLPTVVGHTNQTDSQTPTHDGVGHTTAATGKSARQQKTTTKKQVAPKGLATSAVETSPRTATLPRTQPSRRAATRHSKSKPVRITDAFSASTLGPLWNSGSGGTGAAFTLANGQLVFSIAADATLDAQNHYVGSGITTKCYFPGDFAARIQFFVQQWPPANGATIDFTAQQQYSTIELIQRVTAPWGDGYNAWPSGTSAMPQPDQSGSLRLSRSNGRIHADFLDNNRWVEVGEAPSSGDIWLGIDMNASQDSWQQQAVSAAVDNFTVTATKAVCPGG